MFGRKKRAPRAQEAPPARVNLVFDRETGTGTIHIIVHEPALARISFVEDLLDDHIQQALDALGVPNLYTRLVSGQTGKAVWTYSIASTPSDSAKP